MYSSGADRRGAGNLDGNSGPLHVYFDDQERQVQAGPDCKSERTQTGVARIGVAQIGSFQKSDNPREGTGVGDLNPKPFTLDP